MTSKQYLKGKQQKPTNDFYELTFGDLLDQRAEEYEDKDAILYIEPREMSWSFKEYRDICTKVAGALIKTGVKKGDKVSVWAANVPEWIFALGGTAKMGGVLVTVNTNYRAHELEYLLHQSDTHTLFLTEGLKDNNYLESLYTIAPELKECKPGALVSERLPLLKNVVVISDKKFPGTFTWNEFMRLGDEVSAETVYSYQKMCKPEDAFNMQFTSGTTGFPKGVMLTHSNVINNAWYVGEAQNYTDAERLCIPVPFFHCFGLTMSITTCLVHGAVQIPLPSYHPRSLLKTLEKGRATACQGVPTMWIGMLETPGFDNYDLRYLRTGIMAGSLCPEHTMKQVEEKLAPEITIAYGLTEASPVITMTRITDTFERRITTVGQVMPHIEVQIRDLASGKAVSPGVEGEICSRGYHTMLGYYKMDKETEEAFYDDGFLRTGDIGVMDEEGFIKVTGRYKEMIIRGGENIYPREVEEFLYHHPKVLEAQVIGVPSSRYGEEVAAYIILKQGQSATEDEIKDFCQGKISRHKIPKYVKFVKQYPMTASGKVKKYVLREQAIVDFNLANEL